jgi:hypothetical protein
MGLAAAHVITGLAVPFTMRQRAEGMKRANARVHRD